MSNETGRRRFPKQVLPHLDDAYSLARWLTDNPTDAEDVVQDACMRALRALDGAPVEHPRAWLLAVIRNTAFTWLAKNRPHAVVLAAARRKPTLTKAPWRSKRRRRPRKRSSPRRRV